MLKRLFASGVILIMAGVAPSHAISHQGSASLTTTEATAVPGSTLSPGTYTIAVVDHLSDRYIVRVEGGAGSHPAFLAIPNKALTGAVGEIRWSKTANGAAYLKGWNFKEFGPLEFVYPKDDAVTLAKANNSRVAAIDPASEGRVSNNGLSPEDMRMVTLWLLSPTHVGPGAAADIKAERYQQVASMPHKPVVAQLPHTASYLPVELALALVLLTLAGAFRILARLTA